MSAGFDLERSRRAVETLLAPRNIAIVGANDRPGSWSARTWRNLKQYAFPGTAYPVNPRRTEIWDGPCYPNLAALPEPPDHIAILVPPAAVIDVGRLAGGGWAVVEANPAWGAGICGCDPAAVLPVLRRACIPRGQLTREDAAWVVARGEG